MRLPGPQSRISCNPTPTKNSKSRYSLSFSINIPPDNHSDITQKIRSNNTLYQTIPTQIQFLEIRPIWPTAHKKRENFSQTTGSKHQRNASHKIRFQPQANNCSVGERPIPSQQSDLTHPVDNLSIASSYLSAQAYKYFFPSLGRQNWWQRYFNVM